MSEGGEIVKEFSIDLAGRVQNFHLPKSQVLVPLFEAVVNSIHAIEERREADNEFHHGSVTITILRDKQVPLKLGAGELPLVKGFEVVDNGIGFNESNMQSFLTSDSTHKQKKGGKGVGRFSWLKAFTSVAISSVFLMNGILMKREFSFSLDSNSINDSLTNCDPNTDRGTIVTLDVYKDEYGKNVPKQIDTIATRVIQHCLVYFLNPDCPRITIKDKDGTICLNQLFAENFRREDETASFMIKNVEFRLLNIRIQDRVFDGNQLYLCGNNRLVDRKDLEAYIVNLDGQIFDVHGFWYIGVLESNYLDERVDMNRLSFNMPITGTSLLDGISLDEILDATCARIEEYLEELLEPIGEEKVRRIERYVTATAPQFRHLLKYEAERVASIKPKLSDDKLDDALYDIKRIFDKNSKKEQKALLDQLNKGGIPSAAYEDLFQCAIKKISDANSAALADYVAHRKVIIDLMESGLKKRDDSEFALEKYMHSLVYPMRNVADELDYESHNLWLIDEKLSYCTYISSDVPFDNDRKQERPDLLVLDKPVAVSKTANDGRVFDTIVIFELKRPMRDDYTASDNPIDQLFGYVQKIKKGKAKDKYHRAIRVGPTTKFYLYAVCDLTDSLENIIEQRSFTRTPDGLGYYFFNTTFNAYVEVLSYDKIVLDAKERNRSLFDKLGI